ncbi:MAG: hypothetical protein RI909_883 [Bacteroidota bacterium]|jgi:hypothetical protein
MTEREIYKGIEFVRISNLPQEQSERIKASFPKEKIIKILKDEVILRDCISYRDYQDWFKQSYQVTKTLTSSQLDNVRSNSLNLSLK